MSQPIDCALVSCHQLPKPDPDEQPLLTALRDAGIVAETLAWDDPQADFSRARMALIRATWNYAEAPQRFLQWVGETARVTVLRNPVEAIHWNIHKRYLQKLYQAGLPTVATLVLPRGISVTLNDVKRKRRWDDVVIKPAIAGGSRLASRFAKDDGDRGDAHLRRLLAQEDALVQPYMRSVEDYGERALIWIDGKFTHAVRKSPRFAGDTEAVSDAVPISSAELELGEAVIAHVRTPSRLLRYARVDVVPGPGGAPIVMEVELIEPSLYFAQSSQALERMVRCVRRTLENLY